MKEQRREASGKRQGGERKRERERERERECIFSSLLLKLHN
jgi:hypothetical protein